MSARAAQAVRAAASTLAREWVDPPVLQPAGLYLELLGEDLRARAFMVSGDDEDALCLRPDMTAPAVRVALAQSDWNAPFAVAYDGHVFRRQSDASRETEFQQIGVERFAPRGAVGDGEAEIVIATLEACRAAGATPHLRLGDVALFNALIDACKVGEGWTRRFKRAFARPGGLSAALAAAATDAPAPDNALAQALAALSPDRARAVIEEMLADARIVPVGDRDVSDIAARLREKGAAVAEPAPDKAALAAIGEAVALEATPDKAFAELGRIARLPVVRGGDGLAMAIAAAAERWAQIARAVAPEATFSAGFGRGLAFYDGFVFELEAPALGARASLGGGGRYDGLLHRIAASEGGGPPDPAGWCALGFALRPQRIDEAAS